MDRQVRPEDCSVWGVHTGKRSLLGYKQSAGNKPRDSYTLPKGLADKGTSEVTPTGEGGVRQPENRKEEHSRQSKENGRREAPRWPAFHAQETRGVECGCNFSNILGIAGDKATAARRPQMVLPLELTQGIPVSPHGLWKSF